MKTLKQLPIILCALSMLGGCASVQPLNAGNDSSVSAEADRKSGKRKILFTIGGLLLAGAIIAHEAEDGANDALRDAARP